VERARADEHRLVEEILLPRDVRVEGAFLNAERLRDVADRRRVIALLGEEPGGFLGQLFPARRANLDSLTIVR
jgi:hypothetical protein